VLHEWAKQWQRTFDSIQDMIFIMDSNCKIAMMNNKAKTKYDGVKGKEGEGTTFVIELLY